tara:strand:- start:499 stop:879 length:381 start_codon:yes stop_codon:yes gene_type:complete
MDPNLWGPSGWYFLHSLTYSYPDNPSQQEKEAAIHFFNSLSALLPCTVCKVNYDKHFEKHNVENFVSSRNDLVKWLINIHNLVNMDNGKPMVSYESVLKSVPPRYSSIRTNAWYVFGLLILLILFR